MSTKERVIEQALNMFIYDGVKSVRMDDIATALHMSKRTLYELFGDKETLLIESIKQYHKQINTKQQMASSGAKNVIEDLMLSLEQWEIHSEHNYKLISGLKKFYPKAFTAIRGYKLKDGNVLLKVKIEKGIKQGIFLDDIDIDTVINIFSDSILGVATNNDQVLTSPISHKEILMHTIIYFFRGIATSKGIKLIEEYRTKLKVSL